MNKDFKTVRFTVHGHVQGVGYRWYARERANQCHVSGYVKNLPRGDVQVTAMGEEPDLNTLFDYLCIGPQRSQVRHVTREPETSETVFKDFTIR